MGWPEAVTYITITTMILGAIVGLVMGLKKPNTSEWEKPMQNLKERVSAAETKIDGLEKNQLSLAEALKESNDQVREDFRRIEEKIDRNHSQVTNILLNMKAPSKSSNL